MPDIRENFRARLVFLGGLIWRFEYFLAAERTRIDRIAILHNEILGLRRRIHNTRKVNCNICGWEGNKFLAFTGHSYVWYNNRCPNCHSMPRHRELAEYLRERGHLDKNARCLEIGANCEAFKIFFERLGCFYWSVDLCSESAMVIMDVQEMGFPDALFDLIICSHVLEHVEDDVQAMREVQRVLRPDGRCLIIVPFDAAKARTVDYAAPDPQESDHFRAYGRDVVDRINGAGLRVDYLKPMFPEDRAQSLALKEEDSGFFLCKNI